MPQCFQAINIDGGDTVLQCTWQPGPLLVIFLRNCLSVRLEIMIPQTRQDRLDKLKSYVFIAN
jgi:hypothetical protein